MNQYSLSASVIGDIEPLSLCVGMGFLFNMAIMIFDRLRASALVIISQLVLLMPLGLIAL